MSQTLKLLAVVLVLTAGAAQAQVADLTGEIWSVCGLDGRSSWHDTRLVFTDHRSAADDDELAGYFDWQSSNGSFGREYFRGTLQADGALSLQGAQLKDSQDIITSRYHATVASNGTLIVEGVWLDGLPGIWAAVRDGGRGTAQTLCVLNDQLS